MAENTGYPRLGIVAAAGAAAGLAGLLLYEALAAGGGVPGCGGGSGCEAVAASRWAKIGPVPVAGLALLCYAGAAAAAGAYSPRRSEAARRRLLWLLAMLGSAAALAAVWFVALQFLVIHRVCAYCMADHACGLAAAGAIFWLWRRSALPGGTRRRGAWALAAGAAAVGGLIAGQVLVVPQRYRVVEAGGLAAGGGAATQPGGRLLLANGKVSLDPAALPRLGPAEAPQVLAILFDYTCTYCQDLHDQLAGVRKHFGDRLAILLVPAPLNAACNPAVKTPDPRHTFACEYARLALAVWRAAPAKFEAYDAWLAESGVRRGPEAARARAAEVAGEAALARALADPATEALLKQSVAAYGESGAGQLPQLMFPGRVVFGVFDSEEQFAEFVEHQWAVEAARRGE